jgi:hypothetical protein
MQAFYEQTTGLELLRRIPKAAFFNIAEGYGEHTQNLVRFRPGGQRGSVG